MNDDVPDANANWGVVLAMLSGGPLSRESIARSLGIPTGNTSKLLRRMQTAEAVEVSGNGSSSVWHLPGHGPVKEKRETSDPITSMLLDRRAALENEIRRVDRLLKAAAEE